MSGEVREAGACGARPPPVEPFSTYVVDVATGQMTRVTTGFLPVWLSADTLIVQL